MNIAYLFHSLIYIVIGGGVGGGWGSSSSSSLLTTPTLNDHYGGVGRGVKGGTQVQKS